MRTQGEIEAAVCDGVSRFEREDIGTGEDVVRFTRPDPRTP